MRSLLTKPFYDAAMTKTLHDATGTPICYFLAREARVRKEAFGLLFYDTRNTKLTFVKSSDMIDVVYDPCGTTRVLVGPGTDEIGKARAALHALLRKGLIVETGNFP